MSPGEQDINMKVLQMIRNEHIKVMKCHYAPRGNTASHQTLLTVLHYVFLQYSVPVVKYDRNGFKPRPRQLILTQTAAYVIEEAKIKQRVLYTALKGQDYMIIYISPAIRDVFILGQKCQ